MTSIVWFTRDLRVHDHPALCAAVEASDDVVPVFCLDDRLLHGRFASGPRTQVMLECLADLDVSLRALGGRLVIRHGPPERELPRLAREVGASDVHFSRDVTPFAARRQVEGLRMHGHSGILAVDESMKEYVVFSPFHRAWQAQPRRPVLAAPRQVRVPDSASSETFPSLTAFKNLTETAPQAMKGGETEGRKRLGKPRLSPYLHFGCVSPREAEERAPKEQRRQLAWRDFYHQVLANHPENAHREFQERYRGTLEWEDDSDALDAWRDGMTGYPLVDAGMRQLKREGWMPNRVRLVTASFLVKQLGIDWRAGEQHFMRWLIDGDMANNNGNWQWITSVGVDPAPYFRRLYNPTRHMERFDPRGQYVRTELPELRDVPDEHIAEPWAMPDEVQRAAGCVIGRDYPAPIVDQREARERAIARYRAAAAA